MGTHPIFESDFDCLTEKMAGAMQLFSSSSNASQNWAGFIDLNLGCNAEETDTVLLVAGKGESIEKIEPGTILKANVTGRYSFAIHRSKLKNNVVFDKALNSGFCEDSNKA